MHLGFNRLLFSMDPQSSTGRNTDVEFQDAEFVSDHVHIATDHRVTIEEVRNPHSANGVNECSNSKFVNSDV
ncbi:hypothetical protein Hanom_Chr13g01207521 [Helianthus anomalus]